MPKDLKDKNVTMNGDVNHDASGFKQRHPDSHGFKTGKKIEANGKWHSNFPDANGWLYSSIK